MNYQQLAEKKKSGAVSETVYAIYCRYLNYKAYYESQMARSVDNWNMYLPIDTEHGYGQYPKDVIAALIAQKRAPLTFNLAKPTADLIASGLIQAPFDPTFLPVEYPITKLTKAIEKAMYSDKEICDWGQAYFELVRAGCVMQGDILMSVINDFNRLGNISLKNVLTNSVMYAPGWKTNRMRDCPRCFHEQYLMPEDALEYYGHIEAVARGVAAFKGTIEEYGERTGAVPYQDSDGHWGSALQFIHEYHVETKKIKKVFIVTQHGDMEIPQNLVGTPGAVMDFLDQAFGMDKWNSENIFEDEFKDRRCIKTTICPSLMGVDTIESLEPEVQIGAIPFWTWSCDRINGEPHGVIDQIKDAQRTINYWNSLIQYKIQTEGGGGGKYIDRSKFLNEEEATKAEQSYNDPTMIFAVKPGTLDQGQKPLSPINAGSGVPVEVYQHLDRLINQIWPLISKTTPASRGMLEGQNQSGYLYNLQKIQSDQMVYTIHYSLRQFWNQVYEGYLLQAARQYSNEGIPRTFYFKGGKEKIVLNEKVEFPDGSIGIRNDMSQLKDIRHKIIISDQQQSPTKNLQDLNVMNEYLKTIVPMQAVMPATINYTMGAITRKIDQFDEQDKELLEEIQGAELESALSDLELKTINTQIQIQQAKTKLEQIMNPVVQQQQPGAPQTAAAPVTEQPQINPAQAEPALQGA